MSTAAAEITAPVDYSYGETDKVTLIVRANNKYGTACAGQRVIVPLSELQNAATMSALMTETERDEIEAARLAALAEKKPAISQVKDVIENGIAKLGEMALMRKKQKELAAKLAPTPQPSAIEDRMARLEALVEKLLTGLAK